MHADALSLHFRLELTAGCQDATAKAAARRATLLAATAKRDGQAAVFGERTAKQRRDDEARTRAAARAPSHPAAKEHELIKNCGANSYQRALLCIQMAAFHSDPVRQAAILEVRKKPCGLRQAPVSMHSRPCEDLMLARQTVPNLKPTGGSRTPARSSACRVNPTLSDAVTQRHLADQQPLCAASAAQAAAARPILCRALTLQPRRSGGEGGCGVCVLLQAGVCRCRAEHQPDCDGAARLVLG